MREIVVMTNAMALVVCAVVLLLCRIVLIESAQVLTPCESVQTADAQ